MTIDEMQAGRELDALVAEKVMGWARTVLGPGPRMLPPEGSTGRREGRVYEVPNYSKDISAAWQVVDKLKGSGAPFYLGYRYDETQWMAGFGYNDDGSNEAYCLEEEGDNPALAICRAALKAIGYKS